MSLFEDETGVKLIIIINSSSSYNKCHVQKLTGL